MNIGSLDLNNSASLCGFIHAVLFPYREQFPVPRVLYVAENDRDQPVTESLSDYLGAHVDWITLQSLLKAGLNQDEEPYHYIHAFSTINCLEEALSGLISYLKPGGKLAAAAYGYAGYHGLMMLNTIITDLLPHPIDHSSIKTATPLIQAVVKQLPQAHPAHMEEEFMNRLRQGQESAILKLLHLNTVNVFRVGQLFQLFSESGARFVNWVLPELYDVGTYFNDREILETLAAVPEPDRWRSVELLAAAPREHYFFITPI